MYEYTVNESEIEYSNMNKYIPIKRHGILKSFQSFTLTPPLPPFTCWNCGFEFKRSGPIF
jgi:hypothetical protein